MPDQTVEEILELQELAEQAMAVEREIMAGAIGPEVVDEAVQSYVDARRVVDDLKKKLKAANKELSFAEYRLHEVIENTGAKSITGHRLGTFTRRVQIYSKVVDESTFIDACEKRGVAPKFFRRGIIISKAAVNAECKKHWDNPDLLMPGLAASTAKKITYRPSKSAGIGSDDDGFEQED